MALKETVARLRSAQAEPDDAGDIVSRWQIAVRHLYDDISTWLSSYIADGDIKLERRSKTAHEDSIGTYDIDQLDIDVGNETVRLDPKGAVVIGARGRIDMSHLGTGDPLILVLTGTGEGPNWSLVDRSMRTGLTPLTKETFEAALDRLLAEYGTHPEPWM